MKKNKSYLEVYWIAGTQDILIGSLPEVLEEALQSGITCFQYREKGKGSLQKFEDRKQMARICQNLCRKYQTPFIVNDDVELALEIEADGIHVGQEDQHILEVLPLFKEKIVGLSCYDEKEINSANQLKGLSYYGIGPVFGTISKEDAKPPIGVEKLSELVNKASKPTVAIGGINTKNIAEILQTEVGGAAVISAVTQAKSISQTIRQLKGQL
ncbi:thiamine phosphate synthase [Enterococcus sp. CWB-B31]|uniref:thiamine phosphate synthase n=1 Tax=Enterococcus sp. CWB-B31 TaxID=2885159 RepID=UPI001E506A18|nr:thiamine phosphate synthase [Enterococcus sp. CWB-B31]MCB5956304.1 thiamine phosphate synthase [Enterococcus sp. CWB-B31]